MTTTAATSTNNRSRKDRLWSMHQEVRTIYGSIKPVSPTQNLPEFCERFRRLSQAFSGLFSSLTSSIGNNIDELDFVTSINDEISNIVVTLAESISFASNHKNCRNSEIDTLYREFAQLVANLAEKSPFKISESSSSPKNFNNLVGQVLNMAFDISSTKPTTISTSSNNSLKEWLKLVYEISRALGSLIYQNGSKLSDSNLGRLIDDKIGFVWRLRSLVDEVSSTAEDDSIDLISTQLVYNLTIPTIVIDQQKSSASNNPDESPAYEYYYIDDRFKARVCSTLLRIVRKPRTNIRDALTRAKILTKALQGVENLFFSNKNTSSANIIGVQHSTATPSWIQSSENEFQLGDILTILKEFSFYGVVTTMAKLAESDQLKTAKLEPSDIEDYLTNTPLVNTKKSDDDLDEENRRGGGGASKRVNQTDAAAYASKFSHSNHNRNKKYSKHQHHHHHHRQVVVVDLNTIESSINNSMVCLKDTQVPLIQTRFENSKTTEQRGVGSNLDSDTASTANESTSTPLSQFQIEKSNAKVRIAALGCLLTIFQTLQNATEAKRALVSAWLLFLGDDDGHSPSLTSLLRTDCSPKVRLIAASTLAAYLECACVRAFFSHAASETVTTTTSGGGGGGGGPMTSTFLPISNRIAGLIRRLHEDLVRMVCYSETFVVNQKQIIKALQCLIKATPYQKGMKPGLLYKLINTLCRFVYKCTQKPLNRDRCQLVAECLSCLETILSINYQLVEVHLALMCCQVDEVTSECTSDGSLQQPSAEMSTRLEKLLLDPTNSTHVPNVSQSRVTYFYDSFSADGHASRSQMSSGSATPHLFSTVKSLSTGIRSWLLRFCLRHAIMSSANAQYSFVLTCFDLLSIVCKRYFDLLSRDLFFEDMSTLILTNMDSQLGVKPCVESQMLEQMRLRTLKLLEDLARSLATDEMRTMSGLDLNDCCKLWSQLLTPSSNNSSNLIGYVSDEQRYMLAAASCDCLAAMGSAVFELLPSAKRIVCLTSLLHATRALTSSSVRAAALRALGVYVTYPSLKEDQIFLADLSLALMNALNSETNNLVRQKTAWSLANLSEVLLENADKLGKSFTDEFGGGSKSLLWLRLLDTCSHTCRTDSDKIRSYLVRALGNLIAYATYMVPLVDDDSSSDGEQASRQRHVVVERSVSAAVDALCSCRHVKMLKVKWNLSYSIGIALRRFTQQQEHINPGWFIQFTDTLLELFAQSNNFKVRINACIAIMTINLNEKPLKTSKDGVELSIYSKLWLGLVDALAKLKHEMIDALNETQHRSSFEHQLCKLFTYLCKYLRLDDLEILMKSCLNELKLNSMQIESVNKKPTLTLDEFRAYINAYVWKIHEQIDENKQEVQFYNDALVQLNLLNSSKRSSLDEDCVNLLTSILPKRPSGNGTRLDESAESSDGEMTMTSIHAKKFPFRQTYD